MTQEQRAAVSRPSAGICCLETVNNDIVESALSLAAFIPYEGLRGRKVDDVFEMCYCKRLIHEKKVPESYSWPRLLCS